ncbi:DUF2075 domain-containing protein [Carnobacterium sp. ISL-102]|uniref:DUF2075 domain-containing protein n=1 Tax=Carnobacterium sp. ISL-102 TaxID=2819142 RepID=UPI002036245B|nr:DUF2075 domain-containing protein [Carnobacterium sp. ISL-102]
MGDILESEMFSFNEEGIEKIQLGDFKNFPIVYILYKKNSNKQIAYIGQTVHAKRRMQEHYKNSSRKQLEEILIVGHKKFNQSATYNIETNLINYFIADGKFSLQNKSQTASNRVHDYYQKSYYNNELFQDLWSVLKEKQLVNDDIETLKNKDVFKLSPYKELSEEQLELKERIINICEKHINDHTKFVYFVEGDAGTGKSVVLSSTFNTLQDFTTEKGSTFYKSKNYLLINHSEMKKTYEKISESLPNLKKKNFLKPTSFINKIDKGSIEEADIVFVDEAHLLLSKEDNYNNFSYENQLDEIIKRSKVTVVVYDSKQVLKIKSYWNEEKIKQIKNNYQSDTFELTTQFRIQADDEIIDWMDAFVNKKILPIPEIKNTNDSSFELKFFSDAEEMYQAIQQKSKEVGLSRIVSTFDYIHKKDGEDYFIEEGTFRLPWNRTGYKDTWAEHKDTINEVGSIYTIQGFDLNYVGVILGPSISYDEKTGRLKIDTSKYKDTEAFRKRADLELHEFEKVKEEIILNSINVLMKRGVHGLYMYASDDKLNKRLNELIV